MQRTIFKQNFFIWPCLFRIYRICVSLPFALKLVRKARPFDEVDFSKIQIEIFYGDESAAPSCRMEGERLLRTAWAEDVKRSLRQNDRRLAEIDMRSRGAKKTGGENAAERGVFCVSSRKSFQRIFRNIFTNDTILCKIELCVASIAADPAAGENGLPQGEERIG